MNHASQGLSEWSGGPSGQLATDDASDSELLSALAKGDRDAFWYLWNRYKSGIGRVCLKEMNGNVADAQDAVSEVMIKALDRLPSQAGKILRVEAWLCRVAQNLCIDLKRERSRHHATAEEMKDALALEATVPPVSPTETQHDVQVRVDSLPPFLKEPFLLHAVQKIPSATVAHRLGLSSANVRKRAQLARARLRSEIVHDKSPPAQAETAFVAQPQGSVAEPFASTTKPAALYTACVRLPCGAEQLYHVFCPERTFAPERRINSLRAYLEKHPASWQSRARLAEQYLIVGCWYDAIAQWQKVLEKQRCLSIGLRLGEALLRLGERAVAAEAFVKIKSQPGWPPAVLQHLSGWEAFARNDTALAVNAFAAAADLEPRHSIHWHGLSQACRLAGDLPGALAALDRALALDPDDRVALSEGHDLLLGTGRIEEAASRAERLLQRHPADLLTTWRLLDCCSRLPATKTEPSTRTKALLRRLGKSHEDNFFTRRVLGSYFSAKGERGRSETLGRSFLEHFPCCPLAQKFCAQFPSSPRFTSPACGSTLTATHRIHSCPGACFWNGLIEPVSG